MTCCQKSIAQIPRYDVTGRGKIRPRGNRKAVASLIAVACTVTKEGEQTAICQQIFLFSSFYSMDWRHDIYKVFRPPGPLSLHFLPQQCHKSCGFAFSMIREWIQRNQSWGFLCYLSQLMLYHRISHRLVKVYSVKNLSVEGKNSLKAHTVKGIEGGKRFLNKNCIFANISYCP